MLGAMAIGLSDRVEKNWVKVLVCLVISLIAIPFDYGISGVFIILCFYFFRIKPALMYLSVAAVLLCYSPLASVRSLPALGFDISAFLRSFDLRNPSFYMEFSGGIFAFPLIALYNGEKGSSKIPQKVYYAIYPAHLLIIYIISLFIV